MKVYLESTISSYFTARPSADAIKAERQAAYVDSIVDEVHRIRHAILAEYGGDMKAYNLALSKKQMDGFKVVHLEPAQPFAWNHGERPTQLNG